MNKQDGAAVGGAVVGALFANARRQDRAIDKARRALNHADDAQDTANEALTIANGIANGGDMDRLSQNATRDFLAGVDYPVQQPGSQPSPFAGVPSLIPRPVLSEDLAAAASSWPGAANSYNSNGDMLEPDQALEGQNVATGMALNFGEVRAALLGLTFGTAPNTDRLRQIYRFFQGIVTGIDGLFVEGGPGAQTTEQYSEAFSRYIARTDAGPLVTLEKLDGFTNDTASVSNSTVETVLTVLRIPGGSVTKVGDVLKGFVSAQALLVNSTNTHQVRMRWDSLTGAVLYDTTAVNPAAGDTASINFEMAVRQVGSSGQLSLSGIALLTASFRAPITALVSAIDWSVDHFLVITAQQSVASAGNVTLGRSGQLLLQSTT